MSTTQEASAGHAPELPSPKPIDLPPLLPADPPSEASEAGGQALASLRRFYVGEEAAPPLPADLFPALMHRLRDPARLRMVYPLFLHTPRGVETPACVSLSELLEQQAEDLPRVLVDNLPRMERIIRQHVMCSVVPMPATGLLDYASSELALELKLRESAQQELGAGVAALMQSLPDGRVLACGQHAALHLLMQATAIHYEPRLATFRDEVGLLLTRLRELLVAEDEKRPDARSAGALAKAVGAVAEFLDPGALAAVLGPQRGTTRMAPERERRIVKCIEVLEDWLAHPDPLVTIVHRTALDEEWIQDFGWRVVQDDNPCNRGGHEFDKLASRFAEVVRAMRVGRMEADGTYAEHMHDVWFAGFDWQAFTEAELDLLPAVVVYQRADSLARDRMVSFTRLLLSGRLVQVLVPVPPGENPGVEEGEDPFTTFRIELGSLGVGLRQAFVQQSSSARPGHLVRGFLDALRGTRTALHVVSEDENDKLVHWLHLGSAIESRAHPFFRFNPDRGDDLAHRVDFSENPAPEEDWPTYELACRTPDGRSTTLELPFTFGDFTLLEEGCAPHYMVVPAECPLHELVLLAEWIEMGPRRALRRVPFVWGVSAAGEMVRVAVSRQLAFVCRDRLSHWHTLQELAGIRDEYARRAAAQAREIALSESEAALAALQAAHEEEIARIRLEEADDALRRLTDALMAEDFAAALAGGARPAQPRRAAVAPAPAAEVVVAEGAPPDVEPDPVEDDEELSFDEPYIDTFLCTSCNDCTNINPLLFVYDGNKQARIGDPGAGTFKELVLAAEKCPARCIHPGKPLDASEPGLDQLIARAEPFNR